MVRMPGRSGELVADVAAIVAGDFAIVLSLTEQDEMQRAGAAALPALLGATDIASMHFPITDFGVPDEAQTRTWPMVAEPLHAVLDAGRNVLLHCMGGKGRSGMIALRLLIERGEDPFAALMRIRAVRPGAVETDAQLQWALAGKPRDQTKPTTDLAR